MRPEVSYTTSEFDCTRSFPIRPIYVGNPLACAPADASLDLFETEPGIVQVAAIESQLLREMAAQRDVASVEDIRIKGAIGAIEAESLHDLGWVNVCAKRDSALTGEQAGCSFLK